MLLNAIESFLTSTLPQLLQPSLLCNAFGSRFNEPLGNLQRLISFAVSLQRPPPRISAPRIDADSVEEIMSTSKLAKLLEIKGYSNITELAEAVVGDSVSPAICMNEDCNYTCEMEPDQDRGWCDECRTNSMKSALVLATLI
jgi:hypothetical protein